MKKKELKRLLKENGIKLPTNKVKTKPEITVLGPEENLFEIGKKYVFRTVTMILVGELVFVGDKELGIKKASWVAVTGRWNEFIKNGSIDENDIFPPEKLIGIGRGSLIDFCVIDWELPTENK